MSSIRAFCGKSFYMVSIKEELYLMHHGSIDISKYAIKMAISSREEEETLIELFKSQKVLTTAVDFGGNFIQSMPKIIERALVASKRNNIIEECHIHEGAVAGAAREAMMAVMNKANGLSVGGKIGIARSGEHISVCIFMSIGLLHLNEVVIGIGHRTIG